MKNVKIILPQILLYLLIFGQIQAQSKLRSWKTNEKFDPSFKKIVVIGMIERTNLRMDMEESIVIQAKKNNLEAGMGSFIFPPEMGNPFENMSKMRTGLLTRGYDALLSVAVFSTSAKRYIPPEKVYVPVSYYSRFGSYYRNSYVVYRRPGYMTSEEQYFIECNFYDLQNGNLIWSGRSYAFPQNSLNSKSTKFSKRLFKELKAQGIIVND
jgi:hypothetical protein